MSFDPSARASADSGIFGLDFKPHDARLILIPVPWEATTSYGGGTSKGPKAILEASRQIDLYDLETGKAYEAGYHLLKADGKIATMNTKAKALVKKARSLEDRGASQNQIRAVTKEVNTLSRKLNDLVFEASNKWLEQQKLVGLIGGDHSTPYGLIKAVSQKHKGDFGILHIDAHHDLRRAYEGFEFSHASIMYNVMESDFAPQKLVQVGIRDFSEDEFEYAKSKSVSVFYDTQIQNRKLCGESFDKIVDEIIESLPQNVYISFDIDGLMPTFCPGTGTPVPGGLDFSESLFLLKALNEAQKRIVGFDLNEVAPSKGSEWDANVGARLLYKLCGWMIHSDSLSN